MGFCSVCGVGEIAVVRYLTGAVTRGRRVDPLLNKQSRTGIVRTQQEQQNPSLVQNATRPRMSGLQATTAITPQRQIPSFILLCGV